MQRKLPKTWHFAIRVLTACALVSGILLCYMHFDRQNWIRLSTKSLQGSLAAWAKEGRPQGDALGKFMRDYPPESGYLFVSNRSFTIQGRSYVTIFASTRYCAPNTMFITTNGAVILIEESEKPSIVYRGNEL